MTHTPMKISIVGSSYIARLERYCSNDLGIPGDVRFHGKGGLKAGRVPSTLVQDDLNFNPDVVFLHCGANDIGANTSERDITAKIVEFADRLAGNGAVVYVGELIPRGDFSK